MIKKGFLQPNASLRARYHKGNAINKLKAPRLLLWQLYVGKSNHHKYHQPEVVRLLEILEPFSSFERTRCSCFSHFLLLGKEEATRSTMMEED